MHQPGQRRQGGGKKGLAGCVGLKVQRPRLGVLRVANPLDLLVKLFRQRPKLFGRQVRAAVGQTLFLGLQIRLDAAVLGFKRVALRLQAGLNRPTIARAGKQAVRLDHQQRTERRAHLSLGRSRRRGLLRQGRTGQRYSCHPGQKRRPPLHQNLVEMVRSKNCSLS